MADLKWQINLLQELAKEWGRESDIMLVMKEMLREIKPEKQKQEYDYWKEMWNRIRWEALNRVIPTWFQSIDNRVYWAFRWEIMTIAARTGWWKTTLGLNIATNMMDQWYKIGFISLEMTEEEINDKIISRYSKVRYSNLATNRFWEYEKSQIKNTYQNVKKITDNLMSEYNSFTLDEILETMTNMKQKWADAIFVDWLGMIETEWASKQEQIRKVMSEFKQFAIQNNIAIIAMQQMNREMDKNRAPIMANISDGSSIEKISSPILMMRDQQIDWRISISLEKVRRPNTELFNIDTDRERFYEFELKKNLTYSEFKDIDTEIAPF